MYKFKVTYKNFRGEEISYTLKDVKDLKSWFRNMTTCYQMWNGEIKIETFKIIEK